MQPAEQCCDFSLKRQEVIIPFMKILRISLLLAVFAFTALPSRRAESSSAAATAGELIAAVNAIRIQNGLNPVEPDPILMAIAQNQANYIASIQGGKAITTLAAVRSAIVRKPQVFP